MFPALGGFLKPVTWILDTSTKVASAAGFAKPTDISSVCLMNSLPAAKYTNAFGLDQSTFFAAHPDNQILPSMKVFGTDADEMKITHVAAKLGYTGTWAWLATDPALKILAALPVTPCLGSKDTDPAVANQYNPSPAGYVASMFEFWRGDIKYRVDVVKNGGYSGVLGLYFLPGYKSVDLGGAINWDAAYRIVLDLKKSSTAEIVVEYQTNRPWLTVDFCNELDEDLQDSDSCLGYFVVLCESKLNSQNNVPADISFNIFMSCGDNIQFAVPDFRAYRPIQRVPDPPAFAPDQILKDNPERVRKWSAQEKSAIIAATPRQLRTHSFRNPIEKIEEEERDLYAHMDSNEGLATPGQSPDQQTHPSKSIALNEEAKFDKMFGALMCIGERVDNLRLLTRRFGTLIDFTRETSFSVDTGYYGDYSNNDFGCPLFYIGLMYRFVAGSRRFKFFSYSSPGDAGTTLPADYLQSWSGFVYAADPYNSSGATGPKTAGIYSTQQKAAQNNVVEVAVPYTRPTPISVISSVFYAGEDFRPTCNFLSSVNTAAVIPPLEMPSTAVYTAAGDDLSFGYMVGPPTITRVPGA